MTECYKEAWCGCLTFVKKHFSTPFPIASVCSYDGLVITCIVLSLYATPVEHISSIVQLGFFLKSPLVFQLCLYLI
jgi:hypothetical protein